MNKMFEQFQLNKGQMNQIEGGISEKEYCANLYSVYENNNLSGEALDAWQMSWNQNNCKQYFQISRPT